MAGMFSDVETIDTPDDLTVVINLKQKSAPFLAAWAMFSAAILPEKVLKERGHEFGSNPVGAGAFSLKEWKRGQYIRLEKNSHYWEADRVKLDGVEWLYIPNDNTRILKLQTGEVDAAIFIPSTGPRNWTPAKISMYTWTLPVEWIICWLTTLANHLMICRSARPSITR